MSATATTTATAVTPSHSTLRNVNNATKANDSSVTSQTADEENYEELYDGWRLWYYDFWVLGIVNTWAWGCPTTTYLLPLFRENIGKNHLDIGVGSGYYTNPANVPSSTKLTFLDTEKRALGITKIRSQRSDATTIIGNVLKPLPLTGKYDSVSMYYLLHCIPVTPQEKCKAFSSIKEHMTPDGVLTGANVLGKGVRQDNAFARYIRRGVRAHGIMKNDDDNAFDFEQGLKENFRDVQTWVVGSVFIFKAKGPKI